MNIDLTKTQQYLDWLKEKLYLNALSPSAKNRIIFRGQVYHCKLGIGIGSEESKERPCVILQSNPANKNSPNTIIAPITHTSSTLPTVIPISPQFDSTGKNILDGNVLLGNITCISKARLGDYITSLSASELDEIDRSIAYSLDIYHHYQTLLNIHNDKMKYIEKLKTERKKLRKDIETLSLQLSDYKNILTSYGFNELQDLEIFLQKNLPQT